MVFTKYGKMKKFNLKLKGKTCVMVDWANVYGWSHNLRKEVDEIKLFKYLKSYKKIEKINFYFGEDKTKIKSKEFLERIKKIGYDLVSKNVKFIKIFDDAGKSFILKRKRDFDLEIGLDTMELVDKFETFIFFSGDGDFRTLYDRLIKRGKFVVVVYMYGCLGREVWEMKKGIFKASIAKLTDSVYKKMTSAVKPRRD
jgi:uncharacterized LabA/DUF88 family protein